MQCDSILSESEAQDDSVLSYGCIYYNTSCLMISCFVARSYVFARMCAGANSACVWQFVFECECVCVGNQVCHIPRSVIVTIAIGGTG